MNVRVGLSKIKLVMWDLPFDSILSTELLAKAIKMQKKDKKTKQISKLKSCW